MHVSPFLILKVRHPAVTGVYCIVRDSRSGCSNDFKCTYKGLTLYVLVYIVSDKPSPFFKNTEEIVLTSVIKLAGQGHVLLMSYELHQLWQSPG